MVERCKFPYVCSYTMSTIVSKLSPSSITRLMMAGSKMLNTKIAKSVVDFDHDLKPKRLNNEWPVVSALFSNLRSFRIACSPKAWNPPLCLPFRIDQLSPKLVILGIHLQGSMASLTNHMIRNPQLLPNLERLDVSDDEMFCQDLLVSLKGRVNITRISLRFLPSKHHLVGDQCGPRTKTSCAISTVDISAIPPNITFLEIACPIRLIKDIKQLPTTLQTLILMSSRCLSNPTSIIPPNLTSLVYFGCNHRISQMSISNLPRCLLHFQTGFRTPMDVGGDFFESLPNNLITLRFESPIDEKFFKYLPKSLTWTTFDTKASYSRDNVDNLPKQIPKLGSNAQCFDALLPKGIKHIAARLKLSTTSGDGERFFPVATDDLLNAFMSFGNVEVQSLFLKELDSIEYMSVKFLDKSVCRRVLKNLPKRLTELWCHGSCAMKSNLRISRSICKSWPRTLVGVTLLYVTIDNALALSKLPSLKYLVITTKFIPSGTMAHLPQSLKTLSLAYDFGGLDEEASPKEIFSSLPRSLKTFSLSCPSTERSKGIKNKYLANLPPNLVTLALPSSPSVTRQCLKSLPKCLSSLTFGGWQPKWFSDMQIRVVMKKWKKVGS